MLKIALFQFMKRKPAPQPAPRRNPATQASGDGGGGSKGFFHLQLKVDMKKPSRESNTYTFAVHTTRSEFDTLMRELKAVETSASDRKNGGFLAMLHPSNMIPTIRAERPGQNMRGMLSYFRQNKEGPEVDFNLKVREVPDSEVRNIRGGLYM